MENSISTRVYKFILPDGHILDIVPCVIKELIQHQQIRAESVESGGFLLGYEDRITRNITIDHITCPKERDEQRRNKYVLRSNGHASEVLAMAKQKSYYLGNWHTHPSLTPSPSSTDMSTWAYALNHDTSAGRYLIFLILGTGTFRVWVADSVSRYIVELNEAERKEELYVLRDTEN